MADIALRFFKDMLVVSSPVAAALARQGVADPRDQALAVILEPETVEDIYRLETVAGPQKPQHLLVEIGPCGLPLDPSSKSSLVENRDQYARAAALFGAEEFDAFFLNGFTVIDDLKCALMGLRKISDAPIFASVDVTADGMLASGRGTLAEAAAVMADLGASVAGFATLADPTAAERLADGAREALAAQGADLSLMASLVVAERDPRQQGPTAENPYYAPDTMLAAAGALRSAGVQFLRAAGDATPAYTGVLAAATAGQDVVAEV